MKITKETKIVDVKNELKVLGIPLAWGWEIVLGMLLQSCDYVTIEGSGYDAEFKAHMEA